jgi:hypothetical protein
MRPQLSAASLAVRAHLSAVPDPQIPLLFRCYSIVPKKPWFGRKPLKLLARRRAMASGLFKNSLLIPLLSR